MTAPRDARRPPPWATPGDGRFESLCGGIVGMLDGAGLPPLAGCLVCATAIGEMLADAPDEVRAQAVEAVVKVVREVAAWHGAGPGPGTATRQ